MSKSSKLPLEVCAEIQKQLKSKRLHTEVLGQLPGFDITFNSINKLIERYGPNTLHILHTDPYSIIGNVPGFAFKKVDGIALKFGVDPKCNKRIDECILYLLRNGVSEGNSYLDEDYIKDEANKILHIDTFDAKQIVATGLQRLLQAKAVVKHRNAIVLPGVWEKEVWLSKWLSESKANIYTKGVDIGRLFEVAPFISLNEGQRKAILDFLKYDRLVITGGAGVGKSFLTNSVLKICESLNLNTVLCSPTGKAAKRLEHYTGRRAHTIHKLLGFMGDTYKLDSPLLTNGRVFIVDEVSMCGTELLYILLTSIPPNSIVVLIGDANQLPPVDYGTTLKDAIVYYPIPKAILTECHRQAGELKENCNIILSGKIPKTSDNYIGDTKKKPWYKITSYTTHETIRDYLVQIYTHSIKDKFNYDILKDVQLLTPTHKGPLGTIELNRLLQVTVQQTIYNNPIALQSGLGRTKFYVGDKVINKKNNYDKEIMNGTIGLVKEITTKDFIIVNFEGRDVILENDELDHLYLAYALTVHSYQGDQIPMAIFLCHKSHHYQHSRNLVYTAATRAQQSFVILGDIWAITNCAIELSAYNRNSLLPLLK